SFGFISADAGAPPPSARTARATRIRCIETTSALLLGVSPSSFTSARPANPAAGPPSAPRGPPARRAASTRGARPQPGPPGARRAPGGGGGGGGGGTAREGGRGGPGGGRGGPPPADEEARADEPRALAEDEPAQRHRRGPQREPDRQLAPALGDRVGEDAV